MAKRHRDRVVSFKSSEKHTKNADLDKGSDYNKYVAKHKNIDWNNDKTREDLGRIKRALGTLLEVALVNIDKVVKDAINKAANSEIISEIENLGTTEKGSNSGTGPEIGLNNRNTMAGKCSILPVRINKQSSIYPDKIMISSRCSILPEKTGSCKSHIVPDQAYNNYQ